MDFATFITSLSEYLSASDTAYFVAYAVATCLFTQLVKKIFVNKAKVDVFHKFDFAVVLPFIFGLGFAVVDCLVKGARTFSVSIALGIVVDAVSIGALATAIFKFVSSLSGQNLASLMKNDLFGVFYTQLLYFGNVRQQLLDKTLTMKDFIAEVKVIAANAQEIYASDDAAEVKRSRLARLLSGIVDDKSIEACLNALNQAMSNYIAKK